MRIGRIRRESEPEAGEQEHDSIPQLGWRRVLHFLTSTIAAPWIGALIWFSLERVSAARHWL
jgi:hypothetical protein